MLKTGLYEQVINKKINEALATISDKKAEISSIDTAESYRVLSQYIAGVIEKGLLNIADNGGDIKEQITLINNLVQEIKISTNEDYFELMEVDKRADQLLGLIDTTNTMHIIDKNKDMVRPETSISMSSLFTGAVHEPQMFNELKKEILSCDRVDMLVSFIKWSGLRLMIDELREFTMRGGKLRIITTSYMGATDVKAIEELNKLENTSIKVSYDTKRTRLHAKTYVFYRDTGFTTAYVGSSNMSNAALSSGIEWNIKVTHKDLTQTIDKIAATFNSYWNSSEFEYYNEGEKDRLIRALDAEKYVDITSEGMMSFDIRPYSYQQEILDALKAEREIRGYNRNLVVAATGTGKTVISAFDYKNFVYKNKGKKNRLLFVVHREEILKQSLYTFRHILKDNNFGDLFVGSHKPEQIDHLFISIQTFNSREFISKTTEDFYDFIIVDEFHHAASPTYQKLLSYYRPEILLGLTATPERMDGKSILEYFNNRVAAEIRLPEAIERKLLCPFQYFGVTDDIDLTELKWSRGGYDKRELSNIYTLNEKKSLKRAQNIAQATLKYVTNIEEVKGIGFCVSKEHARFMSDSFNAMGINSIFLTSDSPSEDRNQAKKKLVDGVVKIIFVVDLYNEGVDIKEINTVLFLRPTESLTVFLQQLGRGLRLADNKECLTVLDFIGQANKKYNFEQKFTAILSENAVGLQREIKNDFINVPKGCYIKLEKKAKQYILDNIRNSFGQKSGIVSKIASFEEDTGLVLNFRNFLDYYHIEPKHIYAKGSFSRLSAYAGAIDDFNEELEEILTKALNRFRNTNSRRLINFALSIFKPEINDNIYENTGDNEILSRVDKVEYTPLEEKMLQMIHFTIFGKSLDECGFESIGQSINKVKENKVMCNELVELLEYNFDKIDFVDEEVDLGFVSPLDLYCKYSRDQILVALDFMKPATVREGVKYLKDKDIDILLITLNKSDKDYSPTTMYNDYSINEQLFHWQSQSTTSEDSVTGQRYINHISQNSKILLFVREFKEEKIGKIAESYTFLGKATYVTHTGSRPMNITWKLDKTIPGSFLKKTNKLVVG